MEVIIAKPCARTGFAHAAFYGNSASWNPSLIGKSGEDLRNLVVHRGVAYAADVFFLFVVFVRLPT